MDDMVRKRRLTPKGGESDLAAETLEQQYLTALSQAGGGGGPATSQLAPGEASPGTLESGGIPSEGGAPVFPVANRGVGRDPAVPMVATTSAAGSPDLLVANPFHSERVKAEVALRRSRPTTLDQDAERLEVGVASGPTATEVQLDAVLEPDYQAAFSATMVDERGPRVARVDATWDSSTGMAHPAQAASAEAVVCDVAAGFQAEPEGSKGPDVREDESLETAVEHTAGEPMTDDGQELIPDRQAKIESLLVQVIEENRELRRRLESPISVTASGFGDVNRVQSRPEASEGFNVQMPVPSPQWELPGSGLGWGSGAVGNDRSEGFSGGPWQSLVRAGSELFLRPVTQVAVGPPLPIKDLPDVPVPPVSNTPLAPGFPRYNPHPIVPPSEGQARRDLEQPQNLRQFATTALAGYMGRHSSSGYHTPRSGGVGSTGGFDSQGYEVSPGGTVIRPPPGPPPLSPRHVQVGLDGRQGDSGMVGSHGQQGCGTRRESNGFPGLGGYWDQGPQGITQALGGPQGMIRAMGQPVGLPEEPAKYIVDLPKLSAADLTTSAVTCGNWLAQTRQVLVGLSASASVWFEAVEGAANASYQRWLVADPLDRLMLDPSTVVASYDVYKFQRVESRAVSLLLSCVPPNLKEELVTNRWMTSASILYRILCVYQPGGSTERAYLLSRLVQPEACKTFKDAISCLRRWQQDLIRAREIQASLPDPSLLLKGVDVATSALLALQPMVAFRVSAFRHKSSIDYNPSVTGVTQLVKLIQAECESMAMTLESPPEKRARAAAVAAKAEPPPPPSVASVARVVEGDNKGKGKGKGDGAGGTQQCTKFSDATGCRFGDACRFRHDRGAARKQGRCLACGQKGHFRPDCGLVAPENRPVISGESLDGASPKGGVQPKRGEAKAKAKAGAQAKGVTEEGSSGTASGKPSAEGPASVSQETLLAEAAKLLKGVTLKAVHVEAGDIDASWLLSVIESASDSNFALIDSGATNALRPATKEELQTCRVIRVDLASGTAELRVNQYGTLLHDGACQVIVPAGYLIEMGYSIKWHRRGCRVKHPSKGTLDVHL